MRRFLFLASIGALLAACRAEGSVRPDEAEAIGADEDDASRSKRGSISGVPHASSIERLALSPDAKGALSADKAGSVRLWPALDGSREPLPIPVRGPRAMSLAKRGEDWIVALVDAAGGTHLMRVDRHGDIEALANVDPFDPVRAVSVLPGGTRLLVLGEDHRLRLFSDAGKELAVIEQREFRPAHLFVTPKGAVVAISVNQRVMGKVEVEAQRIEVGKGSLKLAGAPTAFKTASEPSPDNLGLSPDASRVAFVDRSGAKWRLQVVDVDTGHLQTVDLEMQESTTPGVGFVANDEVFVTSRERGNAWLVDLSDGSRRPRITAHQPGQPMPLTHGPGVQVLGYGTWLAVHSIRSNEISYVGFRNFVAQSGATSPSGQYFAWSVAGELVIERGDGGGEVHRLRPEPFFGSQFVEFLDDEHVVSASTDGSVRLYHWPTDEVVDEISLGNAIQAAHFDLAHGIILVQRSFGDAAVLELSEKDKQFRGPYLVADGSFQIGILQAGQGTEPGLWTIDGSNKLRTYRLSELRKDLPQKETADRGETLVVPGGGRVIGTDGTGHYYVIVQDGLAQTLERRKGSAGPTKVSLGAHRVNQLMVSPDGKTVIAVADTGTLLAFGTQDLDARWSFANTQMQGMPRFSADGGEVLVMGSSGAAIVDARSGEVKMRRCGAEFGTRGAAPFDAFSFVVTPSFCE
jgi:WD40 repeat protein